jgi:tRNA pseudouridine38-40 synthase
MHPDGAAPVPAALQRIQLVIAYDGTPYQGWQSQPDADTIQDRLEQAIAALDPSRPRLHAAGRTDAGVHALAQVAHFDPALVRPTSTWLRALNAHLPQTIRILEAKPATPSFHARFSASAKLYRYRIHCADVLPPLELARAWHLRAELDPTLFQQAADLLTGTLDFGRLSARRSSDKPSRTPLDTTRTIHHINLHRDGPSLSIECCGDGFLYKMVRMMVGAMVAVASGRMPLAWLATLVSDPSTRPSQFCAPPHGLYLVSVTYPGATPPAADKTSAPSTSPCPPPTQAL